MEDFSLLSGLPTVHPGTVCLDRGRKDVYFWLVFSVPWAYLSLQSSPFILLILCETTLFIMSEAFVSI